MRTIDYHMNYQYELTRKKKNNNNKTAQHSVQQRSTQRRHTSETPAPQLTQQHKHRNTAPTHAGHTRMHARKHLPASKNSYIYAHTLPHIHMHAHTHAQVHTHKPTHTTITPTKTAARDTHKEIKYLAGRSGRHKINMGKDGSLQR